MKNIKHLHISVIVFFISLSLILATVLYLFIIPNSTKKTNQVIHIPEKSYATDISNILYENNIIKSKLAYKIYLKLTDKETVLRSGNFLVSPHMSLSKITDILCNDSGDYYLIKVTIPEGFSIQQIASTLEEKEIINQKDFITYVKYHAKEEFIATYPFLNNFTLQSLEGYLFPETYYFRKNENKKIITNIMLKEFKKNIIDPFENRITLNKLNSHQLSTLASMIEKEARKQNDMPKISSVFYNRLKKNMPLASDPTIVYALGKPYKKRVYYKDLEIKSPYNTYKNKGLPPTPIASFGVQAFEAALNPISTPYLFFVAKKNGTHHFSRTYQEHLAAQR